MEQFEKDIPSRDIWIKIQKFSKATGDELLWLKLGLYYINRKSVVKAGPKLYKQPTNKLKISWLVGCFED